MTKFFIYLEKVLQSVKFFNNNDILDEIGNEKSTSSKNEKIKIIKNKKFDNGDIFYYKLNEHHAFNFKIKDIIYELLFMTSYDQNAIKIGDKIAASSREVDPKVAGRYGIAFYPRTIPGVKYGNVALKPEDSVKLFDYIRTCGKRINKKKFYFDGAYTEKEKIVLEKIKKFSNFLELYREEKNLKIMEEKISDSLNQSNIDIDQNIINEIILIMKKNIKKFNKMLKKINFILRDELKINFNVREKHFVKILKKEGIQAKIGDKHTRTIFFELP